MRRGGLTFVSEVEYIYSVLGFARSSPNLYYLSPFRLLPLSASSSASLSRALRRRLPLSANSSALTAQRSQRWGSERVLDRLDGSLCFLYMPEIILSFPQAL